MHGDLDGQHSLMGEADAGDTRREGLDQSTGSPVIRACTSEEIVP